MARKRDYGTELNQYGLDDIHIVYRELIADGGMSRAYAEGTWHVFFEKSDASADNLTLDEQNSLTNNQNSPVASEIL